jgi:DNA-binding transcriptional regulator LsrR (DeoR family)
MKLLSDIGITEKWLHSEGVISDINYCFIDKDGKNKEEWNLFMTVGLDHFRAMAADPKRDVVLIAGRYKTRGVKAVLNRGLCSVLITDEATAENLLAKSSDSELR